MVSISRISLLLLVSVFVPSLTGSGVARAEDVFIGAILPMSGTHAAYGHMQKNSMVMAVEEINARGGIGGNSLRLDIRDSGGRKRNARAVIDHFVRDKQYSMVLGGFSSSVAAALADKCEQMRIPLIVMTGSEDAITLQDYRYVFRLSPPRSRYPDAALDHARSVVNGGTVILITERSVYGDAMAVAVKRTARDSRWTVGGEWKFDMGSRNLEDLYDGAAAVRPSIIFLSAFPPEGPRIIARLREQLPEVPIFNLTPASTMAGSYSQCGTPCEGVMNPSLWQAGISRAAARYRDRYLERFESEPDYHGAQAYGAVVVGAQAMRRAGVAQPEPVREALETISVNTVYGRVNFKKWDGFVNQNDPASYLVKWTGTGFEVVWPDVK